MACDKKCQEDGRGEDGKGCKCMGADYCECTLANCDCPECGDAQIRNRLGEEV